MKISMNLGAFFLHWSVMFPKGAMAGTVACGVLDAQSAAYFASSLPFA